MRCSTTSRATARSRICRSSTPRSARCCACWRLSIGARRILEIGTAIGYSGIWLAGALPPGGMLFTMEKDPERARTARANFERAGLADRVSVIVGDAQVTIAKVAGTVRSDFSGRQQAAVRRRCSTDLSGCCGRAGCSSPTTCCGTARSFRVSSSAAARRRRHARDRRIQRTAERASGADDATVPLRDGVAISVKR